MRGNHPRVPRRHTPAAVKSSPSQTKSGRVEPSRAKSGQVRPSQAKSGQARPSQAKSGQIKSSQTKPNQTNPSQLKPSQAKPSQVKPRHAKPSHVKSSQIILLLWWVSIPRPLGEQSDKAREAPLRQGRESPRRGPRGVGIDARQPTSTPPSRSTSILTPTLDLT